MSRYTPGPWYQDRFGHIQDAGGNDVVFAQITTLCSGRPERIQEAKANNALACAAPELLEALEAAVECGIVPSSSAKDGGAVRFAKQVRVADMIRAAIAKAKGEQA